MVEKEQDEDIDAMMEMFGRVTANPDERAAYRKQLELSAYLRSIPRREDGQPDQLGLDEVDDGTDAGRGMPKTAA